MLYKTVFLRTRVAPYVGAWIETLRVTTCGCGGVSHPTWVRGLKLPLRHQPNRPAYVAPYVGAWIETYTLNAQSLGVEVAPYVGAWIETCGRARRSGYFASHPTWVRGLKLLCISQCCFQFIVAPYVGAWIETCRMRKPRGGYSVAPYVGAWIETTFAASTQ